MAETRAVPDLGDQLAAATMKVSEAHMLLSGVVDQAVHPSVKDFTSTSIELLEEAMRELRDIALSLRTQD